MKKQTLLLLLFVMLGINANAQRTIYLDEYLQKCKKSHAAYYLVCEQADSLFKVNNYDMDDKLVFTGFISNPDSNFIMSRQKHFAYFDAKKKKYIEGDFVNGSRTGTWRYYMPGTDLIGKEVTYVGGDAKKIVDYDSFSKINFKEEILPNNKSKFQFYKNGQLSEEKTIDATEIKYHDNGTLASIREFLDGKEVSHHYYDEEGKEINGPDKKNKTIDRMPFAKYDFSKYLSNNLHYPDLAREIGVQGRVQVKFIVMENGDIQYAFIKKGVHPVLDEEALRVLANMPAWQPGICNDKAVRAFFIQPLRFQLE